MRFSLTLALALGALTMTAAAQKHQKPKGKQSYSEERQSSGKGGSRAVKEPAATKASSAQELRRVEQSSAKVSASHKAASAKAAHTNAVVRTQKKDQNPPIHFSSSGGGHSGKSKGGDELKGRLRHKGSRH